MLLICGLVNTLNNLEINYSLNLMSHSAMKVKIKLIEEPHNDLALQKIYNCCFVKRNVTQISSFLKYFIDEYKNEDNEVNNVFYIFSNGFDDELKKLKAWQIKIFNNDKNSFNFTFLKSSVLEKPKNNKYTNELIKVWSNFNENFSKCNSIGKLNIISLKDIEDEAKINKIVANLCGVLLRPKKTNSKKDPLLKGLFKMKNENILNDEYITMLYSYLKENLDKEEFNNLYIR